ncbi:MAG TPA: pitrilysin family protein [Terriglobia bacterium]|nr:pitrilysin family protein [Terriglobia bacterium]
MAKPTEIDLRRHLAVHSHTLNNGLTILLVENPSLPTVSITASVFAGARYDPESKAGLAIMVSRLLDEGTENRTSLEIADAIESVGGAIDTDGSFERIVAMAGVLNKDVDLGLELLSDLLIRPIFPQEYVDKEKERTLAEIVSAQDRPQVVAGWAFNELVYQDHPLHRPSHGYPNTVERLTRDDLLEFHGRYFVPNNIILSVVGDFQVPELLPKIEKALGSWEAKPVIFPIYPEPTRQNTKRLKFITMPAQQLNIYLGHLGISRTNPDYYALQVLDTILGGGAGFTARIPQRLRDELGLAYTTFASITMTAGLDPGRFVSFIGTSPENMKLAINELLNEIRRIIEEPVTAQELQDAQDYLTGSFVFGFESSPQIARFLVHAHVYGLGFDFIEKYPHYVRAVTVNDVTRVARKYLDSENYTLVVVGPVAEDGNLLNGTH